MGHSGSIILFLIICALVIFLFARLRRSFSRTSRMLEHYNLDPADPADRQPQPGDQHRGGPAGGHGHGSGSGSSSSGSGSSGADSGGGHHGGFSGGDIGGGHHG